MAEERPNHASELETAMREADSRCLMESILEQTPSMAVVARRPDGKIISATHFLEEISLSREQVEGLPYEKWYELIRPLLPDGRPVPPEETPIRRALRGEEVIGAEGAFRGAGGELIPVVCNAAPIRNRRGGMIGAVAVCTDMRRQKALEGELRRLVEEKVALYRELAHRVKNHLQIMAGLISLEMRDKPEIVTNFGRLIQGRLKALSSVYDNMARSGSGARVETLAFADHICAPYRTPDVAVDVNVEPGDLTLSSDVAGPLGMILNEAVCNSFKHAFPDRRGRIVVSLREVPRCLSLEIMDDGVGLHADPAKTSQGVALMRLQAQELGGDLEIGPRPGGGTRVALHLLERTLY
jgi:two-component sensor histidine kinase